MNRWTCWWLVAGALLPTLAGAGGTEVPAVPDTLDLATAVALVLEHDPALAAAAAEVAARRALVEQAGRRPNPSLALELENVAGSGPYGGTGAAEVTLSLAQRLERGGKRDARLAAAAAELSLGRTDARLLALDEVRRAVDRFLDLLAAQELAAVARERVALAEAESAVVARQVAVGAVLPLELSRVRIELARARLEQTRLAAEQAAARRALAALWRQEDPPPFAAAGDLAALPPLPDPWDLRRRLADSPRLERWERERRRRQAALAAAAAGASPDLTLALGVRRFREGDGAGALVLGAELDLPVRDRRRGELAAARRRLEAAEATITARRADLAAEVAAVRERLAAARAEAATLADTVVPAAREAVTAAEAGLAKGRLGYTDVVSVRDAYLAVHRDLILARVRAHRLHAHLTGLLGDLPVAVPDTEEVTP